jgi:type VI secretion system secreted protein VgrG
MPSEPTQQSRRLAIETALGPDAVLLRSVAVTERLGQPFQIEVELSSNDGTLAFDDIVGTNATIRLELANRETRYFNGIINRFSQGANKGGLAHYRATLVPWLWLLTRTADCRIFQNKTVPEIIEEVFKGHGLTDYELKLNESYVQREYCVQYRDHPRERQTPPGDRRFHQRPRALFRL